MSCWSNDKQNLVLQDFNFNIIYIYGFYKHICAIYNTNLIKCWGWNGFVHTNVPEWSAARVSNVATGELSTCIIDLTMHKVNCKGKVYLKYKRNNLLIKKLLLTDLIY